jgi:hypothetical protein
VHESGRLQRVAGPFAPEVVSGRTPELVVDQRQHPVAELLRDSGVLRGVIRKEEVHKSGGSVTPISMKRTC